MPFLCFHLRSILGVRTKSHTKKPKHRSCLVLVSLSFGFSWWHIWGLLQGNQILIAVSFWRSQMILSLLFLFSMRLHRLITFNSFFYASISPKFPRLKKMCPPDKGISTKFLLHAFNYLDSVDCGAFFYSARKNKLERALYCLVLLCFFSFIYFVRWIKL